MRVAWFRAASSTSVDATVAMSALVRALDTMTVDLITEARAHAFVVEQALRPYDLCVFEPRNDPASDFIWAYLFHYPGVFLLQNRSVHDSRTRALERNRRTDEYDHEFLFNHGHPSRAAVGGFGRGFWPMLRAPLLASRLTVVEDQARHAAVESAYPGVKIRQVPAYAAGPDTITGDLETALRSAPLRIAHVGTAAREAVERAVQRTRDAGVDIELASRDDATASEWPAEIVVALDPPLEEASLTPALAAMARGKAVIVLEREATAAWPALDPQTWRERDSIAAGKPIAVSIDPRDEEHSLMLALKGLARNLPLRRSLGAAARAYWLAHATPAHAAKAWRQVLEEAVRTPPPDLPADWPVHLTVDGAEQARALATEMGVSIVTFET